MRKIWVIEGSDPRDFRYGGCAAVTMCVANGKHEFNSLVEAVACIPGLQTKNPDWDYFVGPCEKLNHGYGGLKSDGDDRRFFAGQLSKEAAANGCNVSDWVRRKYGPLPA